MAGKLIAFIGASTLASAGLINAHEQGASDPGGPPSSPSPKRHGWFDKEHGSDGMRRPPGDPADFEKFNNVRKAIEALTPEQRKRFEENVQRWSNLSPEEKKALSDRDTFRRKKIAEDIDAALKDAGLSLDGERRELFAKRYGEERHKIEEQIRKEIDQKREPLLKEIIAKLKLEFANGGGPVGTTPAGNSEKRPDPTPQPDSSPPQKP